MAASFPPLSDTLRYRRQQIFTGPPAERMSCVVGDLNADGQQEFVISTRNPGAPDQLHWYGPPDWEPHLIDDTLPSISVGAVLIDLTGNGRLDLIASSDDRSNHVYWWECPSDPTDRWVRRDIARLPANRTHDLMTADIDGDGRQELYVWNQAAQTVFWVPLPNDPTVSPWPEFRPVATGVDEQAFAAADVDGDGRPELVAGCSWYRLQGDGSWESHRFSDAFGAVRLGAGDFDGDGRDEIALCEVGSEVGRALGRLAVLRPGDEPEAPWVADVIHEELIDAHSLQVADFDGDGRPDIFVGEMGPPDWATPRAPVQRIFSARDGGGFDEHVIDVGIGTHEAQAIEVDGRWGVVSKPYRWLQTPGPRPDGVDALYLYTREL